MNYFVMVEVSEEADVGMQLELQFVRRGDGQAKLLQPRDSDWGTMASMRGEIFLQLMNSSRWKMVSSYNSGQQMGHRTTLARIAIAIERPQVDARLFEGNAALGEAN